MIKIFLPVTLFLLLHGIPCALPKDSSSNLEKINFGLGLTTNIVSQYGIFGEFLYKNIYSLQVQAIGISEFQGHVLDSEKVPQIWYDYVGTNFGVYLKSRNAKLGIFGGLGHSNGVTRGQLIKSDTSVCGILCGEPFVKNTYQKINIDGISFPVKIVVGLFYDDFGISLSPQLLFVNGRRFFNILFSFEIQRF
jgi:hypothetical protein